MAQNTSENTKKSREAASAKSVAVATEARLAAVVEAAYILEARTR
ncbi:MAG TPA: hypothetical protein VMB05_14495 [Solirubrobacteraceae bacterium]|nr:hypothetical protein [Solirubrobacteraceae bacterium]